MLDGLAEESQLIEASGEALEIFVNSFVTFRVLLQLVFELLNVSSARFHISGGDGFPHLGGCLGSGNYGLDGRKNYA